MFASFFLSISLAPFSYSYANWIFSVKLCPNFPLFALVGSDNRLFSWISAAPFSLSSDVCARRPAFHVNKPRPIFPFHRCLRSPTGFFRHLALSHFPLPTMFARADRIFRQVPPHFPLLARSLSDARFLPPISSASFSLSPRASADFRQAPPHFPLPALFCERWSFYLPNKSRLISPSPNTLRKHFYPTF